MKDYERNNRIGWDAYSAEYQSLHKDELERRPDAWGVWRIPESELRALGDVAGKDVLELGCGAAQWSIWLEGKGARAFAMDLSAGQLSHARSLVAASGSRVSLVQASAVSPPFADGSFDVVFCDHGAMSFADPYDTVPQAARMLRSGGLLVFCISNPLFLIAIDPQSDELTSSLHADYFGMRAFLWPAGGAIDFQISYGEWLRLFRDNGLEVEDLIELRAPEGAMSTYRSEAEHAWARRWPMEDLWRLRKR